MTDFYATILAHIPKNALRSFWWDVSCCLSADLMSRHNMLGQRQRYLEDLHLLICSGCLDNRPLNFCRALSSFRNLRLLSWVSIKTDFDLGVLRECIKNNNAKLRSINIGFSRVSMYIKQFLTRSIVDTALPSDPLSACCNVAYNIFCTTPCDRSTHLANLTSLSLHSIALGTHYSHLANAINVRNLRMLKLRNCDGSIAFLEHIATQKFYVNLRSLEIVEDIKQQGRRGIPDNAASSFLSTFLMSFGGLEDFYLLMPSSWDWGILQGGLARHVDTLQRLVLHSREENDEGFIVDKDNPTSFSPFTLPIDLVNLEYVGTCYWPRYLVSCQLAYPGRDLRICTCI